MLFQFRFSLDCCQHLCDAFASTWLKHAQFASKPPAWTLPKGLPLQWRGLWEQMELSQKRELAREKNGDGKLK